MEDLKLPFEVVLFFVFLVFLCHGCKADQNADAQNTTPDSWELVFEEEFDNLSSWNIWYGGAFNNEIQLYREEQLSLDSGILSITALREKLTGPSKPFDNTPMEFEYVSGRIESKQLYGPSDKDGERIYRFMARMKLPFGHGMWPAFWSYGDPWPTKGEIDILEARGGEPDRFSSNLFYGTKEGININKDTEVKHNIGQNLT